MMPIRCFTCGKVISHKIEEYKKKVQEKYNTTDYSIPFSTDIENTHKTVEGHVLDDLSFNKYCCRRMFLTHVDLSAVIQNRLKSQ